MRLVFAGTPEVALRSLDALVESDHDVVAVLTRPDAMAGRGRRETPSPVAQRALDLGVEVLRPRRPREPEFLERLTELAPDCCPVVAYGALLPKAALAVPAYGWVNLHFSLLPAWRGAAPVQAAIRAGDQITGATTFQLVEEMDAGPVLGYLTEPIGPRDTAGDVLGRLSLSGAGLLVRTLDALEAGVLVAREQPVDGVSYAPKVGVEDARVPWESPALHVDRVVRACTPEPGAWTMIGETRLGIGPVLPDDTSEPLLPGHLRITKRAVHVGTGSVPVRLGDVRPAGRRAMPAADWARGARPDGAVLQ